MRCDNGLEDWFELLEECTLNSKQRRQALRITQGPRSRASLAAPPSHASLYANHQSLGGTYSSAIEDWLMSRNKTINSANHFILSDSVPDLSAINDNLNGYGTNNSTPQKMSTASLNKRNGNVSSCPNHNGGSPRTPANGGYANHGSPSGRIIKNKNLDNVLIEDEEEVQLRRGGRYHEHNDNEIHRDNWMYRKPSGPHDQRHSRKFNFFFN